MSTTLGALFLGLKYKQKAEKEVEKLLEQENHKELESVESEALELVSRYNSIYDKAETYLDEPYQTSFALSFVSDPKNFWKQLGYCEALSNR